MNKKRLVVGLVVVMLFSIYKISEAASSFNFNVQGSTTGQVGQANWYSTSVTDVGDPINNVVVDVEVHDASGAKVFQQFFENQNFGTGQTQSYNVSWTPSAAGTYSVDVGVFSADWSKNVYWGNNIGTLTATAMATPTAPANPLFSTSGSAAP